ncbi:galactose oxidase early set domain-containing protein [Pseudonocardia sp.]|uniref:galactose oxidase early set domain-containing protein n=1 Tax=Pseudonocardia sp. TaxID=60912 RepID=UPI00262FD1F3|nr:galactose oxidase early set domain-containing protein [Pseudonocardia sp.]
MRRLLRRSLVAIKKRSRMIMIVLVPAVLIAVNVPPGIALVTAWQRDQMINSADYMAEFGRWDVIELPEEQRVNAIHAALLSTGKVLIIAGSGNDRAQFDAGTFRTLLYDPVTGQTRDVLTPADMFCAGHAFLPDGNLLVAGGTQRYEVLEGDVTHAGGPMRVKNEFPDAGRDFPAGTEFVAPDGKAYRATNAFSLPPAEKVIARDGTATVTASETVVWVESEVEGAAGVTATPAQYSISGLAVGPDAENLYGLAENMDLEKQDYQGIDDAFEFDPIAEEYVRVDSMAHKRWYPSLTPLHDGTVLSVSGLDGTGEILPGQNELYDPVTKTWTERPDLFRYFPTYPALFQTENEGELFFTGSSTGYGPSDQGRVPGFWQLEDNTFEPVAGLRDPELMETSGSAWIGPVQDQRLMVVGGGGVGESPLSTSRTDIIDLTAETPAYTPGPDLPEPTRYPNVVTLPTDEILIAGGSRDYRGKGRSHIYEASLYTPSTNSLRPAADSSVGRDYHTEGLLLPNGQVLVMGGDALFSDVNNTRDAEFEHRLEIYTPPYMFHGPRPEITDAPAAVAPGDTMTVATPDAGSVDRARLVRPSAVTHVTDLEQRTVALDMERRPDGTLGLGVPGSRTLVPAGYYMLFLVDDTGTPSVARWVQVT